MAAITATDFISSLGRPRAGPVPVLCGCNDESQFSKYSGHIDGSKLGHCQSGNQRAARRPSLALELERTVAETPAPNSGGLASTRAATFTRRNTERSELACESAPIGTSLLGAHFIPALICRPSLLIPARRRGFILASHGLVCAVLRSDHPARRARAADVTRRCRVHLCTAEIRAGCSRLANRDGNAFAGC
jgi:hypothetical protein